MMADVFGHTLSLSGINHRFGSVVAVRNVDIAINGGEPIALIGALDAGGTLKCDNPIQCAVGDRVILFNQT